MTSGFRRPLAPGEMTAAEARRAVREGRLKRRSLKDLDLVLDELMRRCHIDPTLTQADIDGEDTK